MTKFFFIAVVLAVTACNSKSGTSFTVEGIIKNNPAPTVYLEQNLANSERPLIVDSAKVETNGKFRLSTTTREESIYSLRTGHSDLPFAVLINDSKKISVDADLSDPHNPYTVSGSTASEELVNFDRTLGQQLQLLTQYNQHYDSLSHIKTVSAAEGKTIDSVKRQDSLRYESTAQSMKDYVANLVQKNNSPSLTTYAVSTFQQIADQYGLVSFTPTEVADIVNKALNQFPNNTTLLDWKKTLRPGKAPEFALADTSGRSVSLSSFKGKYVLVDFWASWCRPCRMENPNVVAAFHQFRDKNFTILGVSLDTSKQSWMGAIHSDGLAWNQVSDLKGWDSETASLYGVQSIPHNFLIDPDGNIVAEDVRGKRLFDILNKYLK